MYDARIFIPSLDKAKKILEEQHATFKGEYDIRDYIYAPKDPALTIGEVFLRLRIVPINIWNEKQYIVAIKNTELKQVGKQSIIPVKEQFDSEEEAREFIEKNYADVFEYSYDFFRKGWQYFVNDGKDGVDLEDVDNGHFTIEFKSETEEGLQTLLKMFEVNHDDVIKGPSVVAIQKLLGYTDKQ